ncbi:MAG: hypothetical protein ABR564_04300 [Candidatus Dormibacteria bacterium]
MIRKQLYISDEQEGMLKHRSRDLGVSEAELVRRALNSILNDADPSMARPRGGDAMRAFIDEAERIAGKVAIHSPASREDIYEDRTERNPGR